MLLFPAPAPSAAAGLLCCSISEAAMSRSNFFLPVKYIYIAVISVLFY
jgi:hypothetical protein